MNIKNKILNFDEIKKFRDKNKKKKIILAHGTFDFFHYGHLLHLKKSKERADILVVSITADNFIKKGINRPIYNQDQRINFLSSINFIDYIVIVKSLSGVEIIRELKPNYYSKGVEYKKVSKDYTDKIRHEIKELKKYNGKIIYTEEQTLSSSNIINKLQLNRNNHVSSFQEKIKKKLTFNKINNYIDRLKNKKILVIGDAIIDQYIFTSALSKSPKEEIISVKEEGAKIYLGGIFATANNVSSFVKNVTLLTILDKENDYFKKIKKQLNKNLKCIFIKDNYNNISIKTRYLDHTNKKLFQTNKLSSHLIHNKTENKILEFLKKNIIKYDQIIVNDFGHGLMTKKIINLLQKSPKKLSVNVQTNSANFGFNFFDKYKKCFYLSLDEPEARYGLQDRSCDSEILFKKILRKTKSQIISITYGANGTKVYGQNKLVSIPALSNNVVDSLGAGDAYFAISSLYSCVDKDPENIGFIGNLVGALKIQYLAHEKYIDRQSLLGYIKSFLA